MKRLMVLWMLLGVFLAAAAVYLGVHAFADSYLSRQTKSNTAICAKTGNNHTVTIQKGVATPADTSAKLCDTLIIVNGDSQVRLMAFGLHYKHQAYNGIQERALDKNQNLTVVLNQKGTFRFHDHLDDSAQGTFSVN